MIINFKLESSVLDQRVTRFFQRSIFNTELSFFFVPVLLAEVWQDPEYIIMYVVLE